MQERALRLAYKDTICSFDKLLKKERTYTIFQRFIKKLATKMSKVKLNIAPKLMSELFKENEHPYNLRNDHPFRTCNVRMVQYEPEALSFMGTKICSFVPSNIKASETLEISEQKIRIRSQITARVGFAKSTIKALDIYKVIAFLSGFIWRNPYSSL